MPLTCPRCGADVESAPHQPPKNGSLLACPYCDSTLYCQQGFCLSYEFIPKLLEPQDAKRILRRWFYEKFQRIPAVGEAQLRYIPFWVITDDSGERKAMPAVALPPGSHLPALPEGQREPTTKEAAVKNNWPPPTVPLEKVSAGKAVQEALLVWAPFYWVPYKGMGTGVGAWIEAFLGKVGLDLTKTPDPGESAEKAERRSLIRDFKLITVIVAVLAVIVYVLIYLIKNSPSGAYVMVLVLLLVAVFFLRRWRQRV